MSLYPLETRLTNAISQASFLLAPRCLVSRRSRLAPRALTLIEMLIGMAITLVMMAAVVNLFANIGSGVRVRRAGMEMSGQLRMARARLFKDLAGATCPAETWQEPGSNVGYIEVIDGEFNDSNPSILTNGNTSDFGELDYASSLVPSGGDPADIPPAVATPNAVTNGLGLGDHDCILALTVRSDTEPFVGRWFNSFTGLPETIESNLAEVIWYVVENPADGSLGEPGMRTLYRRVLLIAPWVTLPTLASYGGSTDENILAYYRNNDISAQIYTVDGTNGNLVPNTTGNLIPNTLGDLTKRENRFAHRVGIDGSDLRWPYIMDQRTIRLLPYDADGPPRPEMISPLRPFGRPFEPSGAIPERQGEDLMLNDVLAWDLRVFDPGAPLVEINNVVLEPSDSGWDPAPGNIVGFGAYVSLGWDPTSYASWTQRYYPSTDYPTTPRPTSNFKEPHTPGWHPRNPTDTSAGYGYWATYDTWSFHYENDGIDQDNRDGDNDASTGADEGTNGLDDDGINGTDDIGERETSPPYDVPLRGIQVKIRIYERDSRQIREATVTRGFN